MINSLTDILLGSDGTVTTSRYKDYFSVSDPMSIIGLFFLAFMIVISTLGGVSGNNLMVPIFLIFFKFDQKISVAHTVVLSTLSCVIRLVYEKIVTSKDKNAKNLINFHLVLVGTAPAVLGAFIGVQLNQMSPNSIIVIFTTLLQIMLLIFSFRTFLKKRRAEEEQKAKEDTLALEKNDLLTIDDVEHQDNSSSKPTGEPLLDTEPGVASKNTKTEEPDFQDLLEPEDPATDQYQIMYTDILAILLMFLLNPILTTLRVDLADDWWEVKRCTKEDSLLMVFYLAVVITFGAFQVKSILKRNENKVPKADDVNLSSYLYCIRFALGVIGVSFIGGFLAAGSSTLLSIFMIALNIYPFVASSTTLFLSIIFSGSSAIIYALSGRVYLVAALMSSIVVVISTVATRMTLYQTFLKHGRASVIVLFISISMLISIPSNLVKVIPHISEDYNKGKNIWAFNSFCP
jgi:uncharacterized membrane protein YfcA